MFYSQNRDAKKMIETLDPLEHILFSFPEEYRGFDMQGTISVLRGFILVLRCLHCVLCTLFFMYRIIALVFPVSLVAVACLVSPALRAPVIIISTCVLF